MYRAAIRPERRRWLPLASHEQTRRRLHTTPFAAASSPSPPIAGGSGSNRAVANISGKRRPHADIRDYIMGSRDGGKPSPLRQYSESLYALLAKGNPPHGDEASSVFKAAAVPASKGGSPPGEAELLVTGYCTADANGKSAKVYQVLDEAEFQSIVDRALCPLPPSPTSTPTAPPLPHHHEGEGEVTPPADRTTFDAAAVPAMPAAAQQEWHEVERLVQELTAKPIAACETHNRKRSGFLWRPPAPMTSLFFFTPTSVKASAAAKKKEDGNKAKTEEQKGRVVTSIERQLRLARAATAAELATLLPRKVKIDHRIRSYYYPSLKYTFLALSLIQFVVYFNWIFVVFDWNLMEPTTYFLGYTAVFLSLVYHYVRCGNEDFTWKNLFLYLSARKKLQWYEEKHVDAIRIDQLEARLRRMDEALAELETYE